MPSSPPPAAVPPPPRGSIERLLTALADRNGASVSLEVYGAGGPPAGPGGAQAVGADGVVYGRVTMGDSAAPEDGPDLQAAAAAIGERLGEEAAARRAWGRRAGQLRQVLDGGAMTMLYQPIVTLLTGDMVGVEALARFPEEDEGHEPERWFTDAAAMGLGPELEVAAIVHALDDLDALPADLYLSVNVSPITASSAELGDVLRGRPLERVVFEVTEHAEVTDYAALNRALDPYRSAGLRLAVDDAGAGFASLRHIIKMSPDIIKLDRTLARGIDEDHVLRALTYSISAFGGAIDAAVVAEGIESEAELETLRFLGVAYGQGYHLARPDTMESVAALVAAENSEQVPLNPSSAG